MEGLLGSVYTFLICLLLVCFGAIFASFQYLPFHHGNKNDTIFENSTARVSQLQSWNSFLNSEGIFPEDLDLVEIEEGRSFNQEYSEQVEEELKSVLEDEEAFQRIYQNYKKTFGKENDWSRDSRNPGSEVHEQLFKENLLEIAEQNVKAKTGKSTWEAGVNQFADMTDEERNVFRGLRPENPESKETED